MPIAKKLPEGKKKPAAIKMWLILSWIITLLALGIGAGLFLNALKRQAPEREASLKAEAPKPDQKGRSIFLFFASSTPPGLAREESILIADGSLTNQVKGTIELFKEAPNEASLFVTIPKGSDLLDVYIVDDLAVLNFSREFQSRHPGGSRGELLTIYSLVNTLCYNFPEIKRVQIIVENKEVESLAGHIAIKGPLLPDMSLLSPQER